jgi:hypothetical protein
MKYLFNVYENNHTFAVICPKERIRAERKIPSFGPSVPPFMTFKETVTDGIIQRVQGSDQGCSEHDERQFSVTSRVNHAGFREFGFIGTTI